MACWLNPVVWLTSERLTFNLQRGPGGSTSSIRGQEPVRLLARACEEQGRIESRRELRRHRDIVPEEPRPSKEVSTERAPDPVARERVRSAFVHHRRPIDPDGVGV